MTKTELNLENKDNSVNLTSEDGYQDVQGRMSEQPYPGPPKYPPPRKKSSWKVLIIIFALFIVAGLSLFYFFICGLSGGWILDSAMFYYDPEAEIDDELLNELYYDLDTDSRLNITNETYFLVLSIPELDYTIMFDYLFDFADEDQINLTIEQHAPVPKMTSFDNRNHQNPYELSIEFHINSLDPDILNVMIFSPDNIILGDIYTYSVDTWTFEIRLEEGDMEGKSWENGVREGYLVLPYNHRIVVKREFHHICPFK